VAVEVPALLSCNSIRKVQLSAEHIAIGGMGYPRRLPGEANTIGG